MTVCVTIQNRTVSVSAHARCVSTLSDLSKSSLNESLRLLDAFYMILQSKKKPLKFL